MKQLAKVSGYGLHVLLKRADQ